VPVKSELRILILEDVASEVVLINHELRRGGFTFRSKRVETEEDFLHELQHEPPDVILSDHGLPGLDTFQALAVARKKCPDVPFIFVTGSMGEERAVEALKSGATDYILKGRLSNLAPAVKKALEQVAEREKQKQIEAEREQSVTELQNALDRLKALNGILTMCASCNKIHTTDGTWISLEDYVETHLGITFSQSACPDCVQKPR